MRRAGREHPRLLRAGRRRSLRSGRRRARRPGSPPCSSTSARLGPPRVPVTACARARRGRSGWGCPRRSRCAARPRPRSRRCDGRRVRRRRRRRRRAGPARAATGCPRVRRRHRRRDAQPVPQRSRLRGSRWARRRAAQHRSRRRRVRKRRPARGWPPAWGWPPARRRGAAPPCRPGRPHSTSPCLPASGGRGSTRRSRPAGPRRGRHRWPARAQCRGRSTRG